MDTLNLSIYDFIIFGLVIWVVILSFFLLKTISSYKKLTKGATGANLEKIIEKLMQFQTNQKSEITQLENHITKIQDREKGYFKKYSLLRFNPFEDTGGDQSFVVTFLDSKNNGVVLSSLHSRGGTRVYAKPVEAGKATTYQFSKEEKEVVEKAARQV